MPEIRLFFYQEGDQTVPVQEWLADLRQRNRRAFARCVAVIRRLQCTGHELRRPHAAFLRDGVYELRAREGNVNYRILYFFHGQRTAILAHALIKSARVPDADIQCAMQRKRALEAQPQRHIYEEGTEGDQEDA